ncbi:hypothetical protein [Paenibacillus sp. MMO-58]|uniref:hypothetical protein n=1 Tax=Paenibacillus sp. MMO-58 TaxID=3081290 RepID=UPI0030168078
MNKVGDMKVYEDEDQIPDYLKWKNENPEGFILNINTFNPHSKSYRNLIHVAAGCQSLNVPPAANQDRPVTTAHPKYCSNNINEILFEMKSKGLMRTIYACKHCRVEYGRPIEDWRE